MTTSVEIGQDFLEHYGVKGMKWGVKKAKSKTTKKTRYAGAPKDLPDDELNRRIKRLELEKKYSDLNAGTGKKGAKYTQALLANSGKGATGAAVGTAVSFLVGRELKRRFGGDAKS